MHIIKDIFGKHYAIHTDEHGGFGSKASSRIVLTDLSSAQRLLRSFGQEEGFWRRIAHLLLAPSPNQEKHLDQLAQALLRGKITIAEVALPDSTASPRHRRTVKAAGQKTVTLLSAAEAQVERVSTAKPFHTRKEAEQYFASLNVTDENITALAKALSPAEINTKTNHGAASDETAIIDALHKGDLVAVEASGMPVYAPKSEAVMESDIPGSRPVPAPPPAEPVSEEKTFIEEKNKDAEQAETLIEAAANGSAFCENCEAA